MDREIVRWDAKGRDSRQAAQILEMPSFSTRRSAPSCLSTTEGVSVVRLRAHFCSSDDPHRLCLSERPESLLVILSLAHRPERMALWLDRPSC
jgi:hypothetical protein